MLIGDGTPAEIFAQKEMMERAHLKKPSIMEVWDALLKNGLVADREGYPSTPQQAAEWITACKNERGDSKE